MLRWFIVDEACDIDVGLYEVYPIGRVFSLFIRSDVQILPGDVILVNFEFYNVHVVKLVRNGDVIIDVRA